MGEQVNGDVFVEDLPGHLRIVVEGSDPSHPWQMILTPQAAYNLGNTLITRGLAVQGSRIGHPVNATQRAVPARRAPTVQGQQPTGPQMSADGGSPQPPQSFAPSGPTPAPPQAANNLLGDDVT